MSGSNVSVSTGANLNVAEQPKKQTQNGEVKQAKGEKVSVFSSYDKDKNLSVDYTEAQSLFSKTYDESKLKGDIEAKYSNQQKTQITTSAKKGLQAIFDKAIQAFNHASGSYSTSFTESEKELATQWKTEKQNAMDTEVKTAAEELSKKANADVQQAYTKALADAKAEIDKAKTNTDTDTTGKTDAKSRMAEADKIFRSGKYNRTRNADTTKYKDCKTADEVMKKAGVDTSLKDDFIKANPSVFDENGNVSENANWSKLDIISKKSASTTRTTHTAHTKSPRRATVPAQKKSVTKKPVNNNSRNTAPQQSSTPSYEDLVNQYESKPFTNPTLSNKGVTTIALYGGVQGKVVTKTGAHSGTSYVAYIANDGNKKVFTGKNMQDLINQMNNHVRTTFSQGKNFTKHFNK